MGITFEYNPQMVFMNQIEVEDLGNFCIRCTNDFGIEHYFLVRTSLPTSTVITSSCGCFLAIIVLASCLTISPYSFTVNSCS